MKNHVSKENELFQVSVRITCIITVTYSSILLVKIHLTIILMNLNMIKFLKFLVF